MLFPNIGYARWICVLALSSMVVYTIRDLSIEVTQQNIDPVVHDELRTLVLTQNQNVTNNSKEFQNRELELLDDSESGDTQADRFSLLRKGCSSHQSERPLSANVLFYLYRNVTLCVLPKTGTTNILRMICIMIGSGCSERIGNNKEHAFVTKFMTQLNEVSLRPYLLDAKTSHPLTYTFVRDPWHRIVSTYIQKFIYKDQYKKLCKIEKDYAALDKQKLKKNGTWTFGEFLELCIVGQFDKGGHAYMNEHWRPQHACADVCNIDYDYIAKTETYNEDIRVILTHYGVTNPEKLIKESYKHRRDNEKAGETNRDYNQLWQSVEPALLKRLQDIYRKDIEYFGYSANPV